MMEDRQTDSLIEISALIKELEKDLSTQPVQRHFKGTAPNKETILAILAKAADDSKFLSRLAENPAKVLKEYELSPEERAALASGDIRRIESWVGKLDKRLSTWIWCRLSQEKW
jgi:hypothetical protein